MGMIGLALSVIAFSTATAGTTSKTKKKKGLVQVHVETEINASAENVWEVLGRNFVAIDQWTETIQTSETVLRSATPEGFVVAKEAPVAGRTTVSEKITATEILTAYSDAKRTFTFQAANRPKFLASARNNTAVVELGTNRSKVVFDIEVRLQGFVKVLAKKFQKKMTETMTGVQADLKAFVEAGKSIAKN